MHPDLETTLIILERSLHDPAIRTNPEQAGRLLSADFREFGASGRIWSRAAALELLATEPPYPITARNFNLQPLSSTLALLTYTSNNGSRDALRSSLWRLEDGQWRILFHQGTPIP
jgi:hypothetical protein